MRRTIVVPLALLIAVAIGAMLWADEAQKAKQEVPLKITLIVGKPTVAPCENVIIEFEVNNPSDKPMILVSADFFLIYTFSVTGPDGKAVKPTAYGQRQIDGARHVTRITTSPIKPGESDKFRLLRFNRLFDMSVGGEYTISVSRSARNPDQTDWVTVASNTVKVTVAEPKGNQDEDRAASPPAALPMTAAPAQK